MAEQSPSVVVRQASAWSILWGVSLIILGFLAIGAPFLAAIAVNALIAWLIVLAGVVHLIAAFHGRTAGSVAWRMLVGIAYLVFGAYLIARPGAGVASLTLVLASLFLVEGILNIVLFFKIRSARGSSWFLFDGIVTLLLGLMIYMQWPSSSVWAIGTLVGISLVFSGVRVVMVSLAVRGVAKAVSSPSSSSLAA
ncbi:MAG TPA: DUF308 domain-containing protein [Candidatus Binatia bacterium]|nr:DUF308 domain-containing protein [Candidatus Binatia bacterium]